MIKTYTNYNVHDQQCIQIKKKKITGIKNGTHAASMPANTHNHYANPLLC